MTNPQLIQGLIQGHNHIEGFDYSIAVDWAIRLLQKGKESDNILMLASFSKPIDRYEIKDYITSVLDELGLEELDYDQAIVAQAHIYVDEILKDNSVRKNLDTLFQLCIHNDHHDALYPFYLILSI